MELLKKAFKFQLCPTENQIQKLSQFAGSCRFVFNKALHEEKEYYANNKKRLGYYKVASMLVEWKKDSTTSFLKDIHSQILQQKLQDLDKAFKNFFTHKAQFPRFKKRGINDNFRYPQGFKLDQGNNRVFLPKIGWIKYRNSRIIEGKPKNITVSLNAGKWYFSIQTEQEFIKKEHYSKSFVGIDLGITRFATLSNGVIFESINSYRKHQNSLSIVQRKLSKKKFRSKNWVKACKKVQKHQKKVADTRKDFLHKITTNISKNHAIVVIEDLKITNLSKSSKGTLEDPGKNVAAKSGLNKSILDQGWYEFRRQLEYKTIWNGGKLIIIPPAYTSQKCSSCQYTQKENRKTQSDFCCINCNFKDNADLNAAKNILAAGQAVLACGEVVSRLSMKQEPSNCLTN